MKKAISWLLVIFLFLTQVPVAFAAGSASLKGPGTVRAGDTITLTFSAGGGIYGGSGSVSYDSSQLTLGKYSSAVKSGWKVEFNGNKFVFYDNTDFTSPIEGSGSIFKVTFKVNSNLQPGDKISVTVNSVKVSDGKKDTSLGSRTYSATIAPPLSSNNKLASLTVSNASISPAFSPSTTTYTASVPFSTSSLKVSAKADDSKAKVTIANTKLTAGATTNVTVTVKAENGSKKTYTIRVKRAQDPNYVPSDNAKLKELTVKDFPLSPAFSPDVTQYYVWLPYETEALKLTAATADKKASYAIPDTPLVAGQITVLAVTVTAESGVKQTYTVSVFRAPAHEELQQLLDPQPTEPETIPTDPTIPATLPEASPEASAPTTKQLLILAGICVGCLAAGIALGIAIKSIPPKKESVPEDPEPAKESE